MNGLLVSTANLLIGASTALALVGHVTLHVAVAVGIVLAAALVLSVEAAL